MRPLRGHVQFSTQTFAGTQLFDAIVRKQIQYYEHIYVTFLKHFIFRNKNVSKQESSAMEKLNNEISNSSFQNEPTMNEKKLRKKKNRSSKMSENSFSRENKIDSISEEPEPLPIKDIEVKKPEKPEEPKEEVPPKKHKKKKKHRGQQAFQTLYFKLS